MNLEDALFVQFSISPTLPPPSSPPPFYAKRKGIKTVSQYSKTLGRPDTDFQLAGQERSLTLAN